MSSHNSSHRSRGERRSLRRSRHRSHSHHREDRERSGRARDEPSQTFHGELDERHWRNRSESSLCTMIRGSEPISSASRESDFAKLTGLLPAIVKGANLLRMLKKGCESGFPYCFLTDFTKF